MILLKNKNNKNWNECRNNCEDFNITPNDKLNID